MRTVLLMWMMGCSSPPPPAPQPLLAASGQPRLAIDEGAARRVVVEELVADPFLSDPFQESRRAMVVAVSAAREVATPEALERMRTQLRQPVIALDDLHDRYDHRRVSQAVWTRIRAEFDDEALEAATALLENKAARRAQRQQLLELGAVDRGWAALRRRDWDAVDEAAATLRVAASRTPRPMDRGAASLWMDSLGEGARQVLAQQRRLTTHALQVSRVPSLVAAFNLGETSKGSMILERARLLSSLDERDVAALLEHLEVPLRQRVDESGSLALAAALEEELDRVLAQD